MARLHDAYDRCRQLGATASMARVRARLRATGVRLQPGRRSGRPAFGWGSLTATEQRIAHLVADGLTNRQIARHLFLSSHTVAFHLRRIFCKLDLVSRAQLASLAADKARTAD